MLLFVIEMGVYADIAMVILGCITVHVGHGHMPASASGPFGKVLFSKNTGSLYSPNGPLIHLRRFLSQSLHLHHPPL